jgi:pyruvate/2-oxoglutarate dehydrogenase complex dihydrolipoamide acyltransferase (E2) component
MATKVIMPQLGESVVEGTVTKWLKQEGEEIGELEALLEVNTDKVDTEIPSPAGGKVLRILIPEGQTVRAGTVLAWIGEVGETIPGDGPKMDPAGQAAQPGNGHSQQATAAGMPPISVGRSQKLGFISPVVAKIARENDVDLAQVKGSGAGGRITKRDVQAFVDQRAAAPASPSKPVQSEAAAWETPADGDLFRPSEMVFGKTGTRLETVQAVSRAEATQGATLQPTPDLLDSEIMPLSPIRKLTAAHMVQSERTAPHVTTVMETDLSRVMAHRTANLAAFERDGAKLTYSSYFAAAAVAALKAFPAVNSSWSDEGLRVYKQINVGMAASLGDEGLIVPVIRGADGLSLLGLARAINDLAARARAHRLQPGEVQGGTFTITNHGISGSLVATPIINFPQCAILGVGAIQKRAVVVEAGGVDAIAIRPMVYLGLTFDHRILDGAIADHFLAKIVDTLQNWV